MPDQHEKQRLKCKLGPAEIPGASAVGKPVRVQKCWGT